MTSNAAADEIQQIIKQERALKASSAEVNEEELKVKREQERQKKVLKFMTMNMRVQLNF